MFLFEFWEEQQRDLALLQMYFTHSWKNIYYIHKVGLSLYVCLFVIWST